MIWYRYSEIPQLFHLPVYDHTAVYRPVYGTGTQKSHTYLFMVQLLRNLTAVYLPFMVQVLRNPTAVYLPVYVTGTRNPTVVLPTSLWYRESEIPRLLYLPLYVTVTQIPQLFIYLFMVQALRNPTAVYLPLYGTGTQKSHSCLPTSL
jgi:hypothetical protein